MAAEAAPAPAEVRRMPMDHRRAVYLRDRSELTPAQRRRIRHKSRRAGA